MKKYNTIFLIIFILLNYNFLFAEESEIIKVRFIRMDSKGIPEINLIQIEGYLTKEFKDDKNFIIDERKLDKRFSENEIKIDSPDKYFKKHLKNQEEGLYIIYGIQKISKDKFTILIFETRIEKNKITVNPYKTNVKNLQEIEKKSEILSTKIIKKIKDENLKFSMTTKFVFAMPFGKASDIFDYGYGTSLYFSFENAFVKNLILGLDSGFFWSENPFNKLDNFYSLFFIFDIKYAFYITNWFFIAPVIGTGLHLSIYEKGAKSVGFDMKENTTRKIPNSISISGIELGFVIHNNLSIMLSSKYQLLIDKKYSHLQILSFNFGLKILF